MAQTQSLPSLVSQFVRRKKRYSGYLQLKRNKLYITQLYINLTSTNLDFLVILMPNILSHSAINSLIHIRTQVPILSSCKNFILKINNRIEEHQGDRDPEERPWDFIFSDSKLAILGVRAWLWRSSCPCPCLSQLICILKPLKRKSLCQPCPAATYSLVRDISITHQ